jgi:hypothetical protein
MNRILWAALVAGVALLIMVRIVATIGAPLFILLAVIALAALVKGRNAYVGHRASGIDELNSPGRAVTVDDRTSRWWDAEQPVAPHPGQDHPLHRATHRLPGQGPAATGGAESRAPGAPHRLDRIQPQRRRLIRRWHDRIRHDLRLVHVQRTGHAATRHARRLETGQPW